MGHQHAVTKSGTECYCGDSFNREGIGGLCHKACSGDADEICGGTNRLMVYRIYPLLWTTGLGVLRG